MCNVYFGKNIHFDLTQISINNIFSVLLPSSWEYENPEQQHSSSAQGRWCAQERKGTNAICGLAVIFFLSHKLVEQTAVCEFDVFVCTHFCSEEQSRLAARKYARVVQKLGFPAKFLDFKIQNMVGSCDVKFPIRLEGLVLTHQQFSRFVLFIRFLFYFMCPISSE